MGGIHKFAILAGAAALAMTVGGCEKYGSQGKADVGKIKDTIKADEKAWNDQFQAKDLNGLVAHYSNDAYFVAPGMKPSSGSTDVNKAYAEALGDQNFSITFASDKIDVAGSGDLAYARGHFSEKYTDPATKQVKSDSGSYITVYKKQDDGSWKAVEDFAAANPTEAPAAGSDKPATRAKMVSF